MPDASGQAIIIAAVFAKPEPIDVPTAPGMDLSLHDPASAYRPPPPHASAGSESELFQPFGAASRYLHFVAGVAFGFTPQLKAVVAT